MAVLIPYTETGTERWHPENLPRLALLEEMGLGPEGAAPVSLWGHSALSGQKVPSV